VRDNCVFDLEHTGRQTKLQNIKSRPTRRPTTETMRRQTPQPQDHPPPTTEGTTGALHGESKR
jgi:hypothetical protein